MKLAFCVPDEGKGLGGLDAAISMLRDELRKAGCTVGDLQPEPTDAQLQEMDVVHFHGLWHPWHSRLSARLRDQKIPYVVSPHGMLEPWAWRHKIWKKLPYYLLKERSHLAGATVLLTTSAMEASNLKRFAPHNRIDMVPLGLTGNVKPDYDAARRQLGWTNKKRTILYLSRIHPKKGLDMLLRALAFMQVKEFCRLVVVGGGDAGYLSEIEDIIERNMRALPEIEWVGEVWGDERWKYFQAADLFCLPTHSENFGLAVLEALQVGTPVLTTTRTPWSDFLEDTNGGIIVPPNVDSIQGGLAQFFRQRGWSDTQRQALAAWAWKMFGWDQLSRRMLDIYESIAK